LCKRHEELHGLAQI
jgi:hypothetical protein